MLTEFMNLSSCFKSTLISACCLYQGLISVNVNMTIPVSLPVLHLFANLIQGFVFSFLFLPYPAEGLRFQAVRGHKVKVGGLEG